VSLQIPYLLMRWLFGLVVLVVRGDRAKDAELLVVRYENVVLRRTAGRIGTSPATGPGSLRWPRSSRGGGGPGSSR
jgi:hypothetical protein